ncbi:uncharacterized protein LOC113286517 [Papaver somniferum]|uniref:uncharacterized protein LOC113286517 n=1 Tax=Papaver somniferum TaxID=3469 RepID=UPI000E70533E|nr:uncharacterized protein LOC113286517 [Papaver somniferum]
MLLLSQAPNGGSLSTRRYTISSHPQFPKPNPPLFSRKHKFTSKTHSNKPFNLIVANAEAKSDSPSSSATTKQPLNPSPSPPPPPPFNETVRVGEESVPLEGVIQFDKPSSSLQINKWGRIALLSGGDVLALLLFSAIGRFSHGFPVFDIETLRTADPFIAGWFLSAYFLGGYGEDGRGVNGFSKALTAATKSWAMGIPLGIVIRSTSAGHIPKVSFMLVTMASTAVFLIGWRALLLKVLPNDKKKKDDTYRSGSAFELFELLTSLVRRW